MPTQGAWISIFTEEVWQDPVRNKNRRAFPLTRPILQFLSQLRTHPLVGGATYGRLVIRTHFIINPHSPDSVLNFWRGFRDSDIAISSLFWIKRGSDGEPDG